MLLSSKMRRHPLRAKVRDYCLIALGILVAVAVTALVEHPHGLRARTDAGAEKYLVRRAQRAASGNYPDYHPSPSLRKLLQTNSTESNTTSAVIVEDDDSCDPLADQGNSSALYPPELFSEQEKKDGAIVLYVIGVIYMFFALAIVCDEFFVPALEVIVEKLQISNDVAGATFMAAGGSAPELCTSVVGTFISKSNVGFGTIVGSAVFNVLFVIAMCALFSNDVLTVTWWPLARDCSYYALSLGILAVLFGVVSRNEIRIWEAFILLCMYGGYVTLMKFNVQLMTWAYNKLGLELPEDENGVEMATGEGQATNRTTLEDQKVSTFRAGFTSLLIHNKTIEHAAALHIVAAIRGDVKTTFQKVDADQSGFIDKDELKQMLVEMGGHPTDEEVQSTMAHVDLNKDGKISFDEFTRWYSASEERVKIELLQAFNRYDKDSSGYIDAKELKLLLDEMHGSVSNEFVDDIMLQLDKDKDGQLSRSEFELWYCQTEFFHAKHHEAEEEAEDAEGLSLAWPSGIRSQAMYLFLMPITWSLVLTLPNVRTPEGKNKFAITFFGSIAWVACFSYFMVWWAEIIGQTISIPPAVMGLTVLAAGTSIPDLLTSVIVAKQGEGDMAVSSSIGSNIFDILVGLPLPWFIAGMFFEGNKVDVVGGTLFLNVIILFGMLVSIIIIIHLSGWKLTRLLAGSMLLLYVIYVIQDLLRTYLCLD